MKIKVKCSPWALWLAFGLGRYATHVTWSMRRNLVRRSAQLNQLTILPSCIVPFTIHVVDSRELCRTLIAGLSVRRLVGGGTHNHCIALHVVPSMYDVGHSRCNYFIWGRQRQTRWAYPSFFVFSFARNVSPSVVLCVLLSVRCHPLALERYHR